MAWYSDEAYSMISDSREKKSTAASAFKAKTHCGKGGAVKLPSDNMTKKELNAMNGECKSYNLRKPMSWEQFKAMPNDLQIAYIKWIREYFGAPDKWIGSALFGVSQKTISMYILDLKLNVGKNCGNGRKKWEKESFLAWCTGADAKASKELVSGEAEVEETEESVDTTTPEAPVQNTVETYVNNFFNNEAIKQGFMPHNECINKPLVPVSGELRFEGNVDEILHAIQETLSDNYVCMTVQWSIVKE